VLACDWHRGPQAHHAHDGLVDPSFEGSNVRRGLIEQYGCRLLAADIADLIALAPPLCVRETVSFLKSDGRYQTVRNAAPLVVPA